MMNVSRISMVLFIVSGLTAPAQAEEHPAHPDVVWAVEYQIPDHNCKKPTLRNTNQPNQIERFERKSRRYVKCVAKYQAVIIEDHQRIVSAAEHGINSQQAEVMVENLRTIEATVVELGEGVNIELDPIEAERLLSQGNRPSI